MQFNFKKLIEKQGQTTFNIGSEFRDPDILQQPLHNLQRWDKMKTIITKGASYPIDQSYNLTKESQLKDIKGAIKQGNNKSASASEENKKIIIENYNKEVKNGWMIPFLKEDIINIEGAGVIPVGVMQQTTINEKGEVISKQRLTHNASRPRLSGTSVNSICDKEQLDPYLFPYCLLRTLHQIHVLRTIHPTIPILMTKYDLDAAYRRIHVALRFAILCITVIGRIAFLLLRLPFGTTPAADQFCTVSELVTDLAQEITEDKSWNPENLKSDLSHLIPSPESPKSVPPLESTPSPLFVPVIAKHISSDVYIDDIITTVLAINTKTITRGMNAAPLAIHTIFQPVNPTETIARQSFIW